MKRRTFAIMLMPLALAACTAEDTATADTTADDVLIACQVTADSPQTRAEAITPATFAQDGRQFALWGWMTDGETSLPMNSDFNSQPLSGAIVTYHAATATWDTDVTYYWPIPRYRADFYAFYPTSVPFQSGTKAITYTAASPFLGNADVMYATYSDQRPKKDKKEKQRAAHLHFYHAMAQVQFSGILSPLFADFGYTVQVQSITLCNINSAATLTFDASGNTLGDDGLASAMTCTDLSNPRSYDATMNGTAPITVSSTNPIEAVTLTDPADPLLLLPQTLTAWNPGDDHLGTDHPQTSGSYLAIALILKDSDQKSLLTADGTATTVYVPFDSGQHDGWESGKIYKYMLTFGAGYHADGSARIQPITITAAIQDWTDLDAVSESIVQPNAQQ